MSRSRNTLALLGPTDGGIAAVVDGVAAELERNGWRIARPPVPSGRVPALGALRWVAANRRLLRDAGLVHVEFGRLDLGLFWAGLVTGMLRRDLVLVCHDAPRPILAPAAGLIRTGTPRRDAFAYRVLAPALDRLMLGLLYRAAAVGVTFGADAARAWRGPPFPTAVDHGADPPRGGPLPSQGAHVLFAGFIDPRKGLDLLLDAWEEVGPSTRLPLVIAGEGTLGNPDVLTYVRRQRERSKTMPNPPRWLGHVPDERLAELFAQAALVVMPYRSSNPASGVLVRAMVEGRPVLATTVPAALDALGGGGGELVARDDARALAAALRRLVEDGELRDRLGAAGAAQAAGRFTWKRHAEQLEAAYAVARRGR